MPKLQAATGEELRAAMYQMADPVIDTTGIYTVDSTVLTCPDLKLHLDKGQLALFEPIRLDSGSWVYGAFFVGNGTLQFQPPDKIEKDQLHRFFESDSLNREISAAVLLFNRPVYEQIVAAGLSPVESANSFKAGECRELIKFITRKKRQSYFFRALKNNIYPLTKPYLLTLAKFGRANTVAYECQPYWREEIALRKSYFRLGRADILESVSRYRITDNPSRETINGVSKAELKAIHYDIDAIIWRDGKLRGEAKVDLKTVRTQTQMHSWYLHSEMRVDSILDQDGRPIAFHRYHEKKNRSSELLLFLDKPWSTGEEVSLKFCYSGEVAEVDLGEFYVHAGADWYPRYSSKHRATFDMTFRTKDYYVFVATGDLVDSSESGDTLITRWQVTTPTYNVSFTTGTLKKYEFQQDSVVPVEIYFSKSLHKSFASLLAEEMVAIGRNMEKQVGDDVIKSLKLFSHYFGPYPHKKMRVGEILYSHGEAFPGFIHLGFSTWMNTDSYGYDRRFRAHEVAHQWWGVNVGYATYHDQWLSEGFSEYSALMYLQAVGGNDQFLDRLKDYRDKIFSARKYLFGSGEESGPIALGYRTSSSETPRDYGLVVYKKGAYVLHMLRNMLVSFESMDESRFF